MNNKKEYNNPIIEINKIDKSDIIITSGANRFGGSQAGDIIHTNPFDLNR